MSGPASVSKQENGQTAHACPHRRLANIDEIAEYLDVPKGTIYQWSSRGNGPRLIKVGRHIKARWSDLDAYLDAHTVGAA
ncbi:helix-turn-helix transcriptional regulator [Streptantibioticus rubrisoli]|uniref:Helix-turn-helix domain-containing protein n=1 Tax=Streptantibioticus rubrisoli TaxID=1387313 RepID=A0ABT1PEN8_9ACTN|nr:helix-turn-helix domain-containing protein [Streptantibioticus rubrisoli]MCQ4043841.1 helix-turn-helix domain-containing protein [Streptantibioticus rubrisoli]